MEIRKVICTSNAIELDESRLTPGFRPDRAEDAPVLLGELVQPRPLGQSQDRREVGRRHQGGLTEMRPRTAKDSHFSDARLRGTWESSTSPIVPGQQRRDPLGSRRGSRRFGFGRIVGGGRAGTKTTVTTWSSMTGQVLALREHLPHPASDVRGDGGDQRLLETVLLRPGGRPVGGAAGQRPRGPQHARTQDGRLGRGVVGPARRTRPAARLVRATGPDPRAAGPDPHPNRLDPGTLPGGPTPGEAPRGRRDQARPRSPPTSPGSRVERCSRP